ncbi:Uncharacterised protein [Mycobacteroides abscessus subsp. massiliense]|nr:Uncharacterised protein [Mycobacteroides abscessus subsp. massiliense]
MCHRGHPEYLAGLAVDHARYPAAGPVVDQGSILEVLHDDVGLADLIGHREPQRPALEICLGPGVVDGTDDGVGAGGGREVHRAIAEGGEAGLADGLLLDGGGCAEVAFGAAQPRPGVVDGAAAKGIHQVGWFTVGRAGGDVT